MSKHDKNNNIKKTEKRHKRERERVDSSDISTYDSDGDNLTNDDNLTNEDIQREARTSYVQNELLERITKYLKIDNAIKEKQKEIREYVKAMKEQKDSMEKYIIGYLNEVDQDFIKIDGEGKLIKATSVTKGAIKTDNIKESVAQGLNKENIMLDEKKFNELIGSILNSIEANRPKKERTYIKRSHEQKNKKNDSSKNSSKNLSKKKIQPEDSDEELPKYKN
jgi:hypothetical protein